MNTLEISMLIISGSTLLGYIATKHFNTQPSISILTLSLLIVAIGNLFFPAGPNTYFYQEIASLIKNTDFKSILINLMLPILLFAGSLTMNTSLFLKNRYTILSLASISTILSTLLIGYGFFIVNLHYNLDLTLPLCMLFGALISPTDPVAVVSMIKKTKLSPDIEANIAGESLFNDGIGIVIFLSIYDLAFSGNSAQFTFYNVANHFCYEAIGGCIIGILTGRLCQWLITHESRFTHNHILINVFVVTGVYTLANAAHFSGPLAIVICGLMISHHTRHDKKAHHLLYHFWETLEDLLNMILYLLIGFEAFSLPYNTTTLIISVAAIILSLLSRIITVGGPLAIASKHIQYEPKMLKIMIWGGLRGGLAIALALSLPDIPQKEIILIATYAVVCFTTIVQGGTIMNLIKD